MGVAVVLIYGTLCTPRNFSIIAPHDVIIYVGLSLRTTLKKIARINEEIYQQAAQASLSEIATYSKQMIAICIVMLVIAQTIGLVSA